MGFFESGRALRGFETGIQYALARMLVDPQFIFRFERAPANVRAGAVYRISDLELASRLSFFLWSSIPDDELLGLAAKGRLADPAVLEQQTRRMLADPTGATRWSTTWPASGCCCASSTTSRPARRSSTATCATRSSRETELLFETIVREDRSILDLSTPTTRSSTSGWPATTASPTSAAAGSAA